MTNLSGFCYQVMTYDASFTLFGSSVRLFEFVQFILLLGEMSMLIMVLMVSYRRTYRRAAVSMKRLKHNMRHTHETQINSKRYNGLTSMSWTTPSGSEQTSISTDHLPSQEGLFSCFKYLPKFTLRNCCCTFDADRRYHAYERAASLPSILPSYVHIAMLSAALIFVEAIFFLLPSHDQGVRVMRYVLFAGMAFIDNIVLAYLWRQQRVPGAHGLIAFFVGFAVFAVLLTFIFLVLPHEENCAWCSLHFPEPLIEFPYLFLGAIYTTIAISARWPYIVAKWRSSFSRRFCRRQTSYRLHSINNNSPTNEVMLLSNGSSRNQSTRNSRPMWAFRPQAVKWSSMLAVAYGFSSLGLLLVNHAKVDAGFCIMELSALYYVIAYAPIMYFVFLGDTKYLHLSETVNQVLDPFFGGSSSSTQPSDHTSIQPANDRQLPRRDFQWQENDVTAQMTVKLMAGELQAFSIDQNDIELKAQIGQGAYGSVYRAQWKHATVAVKSLDTRPIMRPRTRDAHGKLDLVWRALLNFLKEASTLAGLRHPNIVAFYGVAIGQSVAWIVTEFVERGSVFDALHCAATITAATDFENRLRNEWLRLSHTYAMQLRERTQSISDERNTSSRMIQSTQGNNISAYPRSESGVELVTASHRISSTPSSSNQQNTSASVSTSILMDETTTSDNNRHGSSDFTTETTNFDASYEVFHPWARLPKAFAHQMLKWCEREAMRSDTSFNLNLKLKIMRQTIAALRCMHEREEPILHRDLKSPNLLLTQQHDVKCCDFGLSRVTDGTARMSRVGTIQWTAPEVLNCQPYNQKADVWSFGVICWELMATRMPFEGLTQPQAAVALSKGTRLPLPNLSLIPSAADLKHPIDAHTLSHACYLTPDEEYSALSSMHPAHILNENDAVVMRCWPPVLVMIVQTCCQNLPANRPSFKKLHEVFDQIETPADLFDANVLLRVQQLFITP